MSEQPRERKNRFQISREVQEEFVNGIAETMLSLAEKAGDWQRGWTSDTPVGMPFCPVTGREYSGANLVRLLLTTIVKGYADDRWMTFNQLQSFQNAHPELQMNIRKGERGVKVLRPEEVAYIVEENGAWKFLTREELRRIEEMKDRGQDVPDVQRKTLFYPFTVFNAAQIEGFPAKERPAHAMTQIERHEMVERFIASSGVHVRHYGGDVKAVFQAASEAAKILTVLHQFESDEQPAARWFPRREAWPELVELQKQRDAACGVSFHAEETSGSQVFERLSRNSAFSEPLSFTEAAVAFKNTDNLVTKTRLILQNPDFLNLALKQDPDSVMELAALFDKMAHVLHMEMDDKLRSAPGALEHNAPLLEQQAASAQRMRI